MLARQGRAECTGMIALLFGLVACSHAAEPEASDTENLMFLEYLASWDESDEDWLLFTSETAAEMSHENNDAVSPDADEEKLVEPNDAS